MLENSFEIRINNPKYVLPVGRSHDFTSIFRTCFDTPTDNFEIIWNGEIISCPYKYQVSHVVYGVMDMMDKLIAAKYGETSVHVGGDTLHSRWHLKWENDNLFVKTVWHSAPENLESRLNDKSELTISLSKFIGEWVKLFEFLEQIIVASGIKILDYHYNSAYLNKLLKKMKKAML